MDREKLMKRICDLLPVATLKQLRLLYMVAFEIIRKVWSQYNKNKTDFQLQMITKEDFCLMSRNEMIDYITERLQTADDFTVEQVFEFLAETEYWKEVIRYLIQRKGGMYALLYR